MGRSYQQRVERERHRFPSRQQPGCWPPFSDAHSICCSSTAPSNWNGTTREHGASIDRPLVAVRGAVLRTARHGRRADGDAERWRCQASRDQIRWRHGGGPPVDAERTRCRSRRWRRLMSITSLRRQARGAAGSDRRHGRRPPLSGSPMTRAWRGRSRLARASAATGSGRSRRRARAHARIATAFCPR